MDEVDSIHAATERLLSSMGDTPEMVRQARILALVGVSFDTLNAYYLAVVMQSGHGLGRVMGCLMEKIVK